jgi:hypothetical protein
MPLLPPVFVNVDGALWVQAREQIRGRLGGRLAGSLYHLGIFGGPAGISCQEFSKPLRERPQRIWGARHEVFPDVLLVQPLLDFSGLGDAVGTVRHPPRQISALGAIGEYISSAVQQLRLGYFLERPKGDGV